MSKNKKNKKITVYLALMTWLVVEIIRKQSIQEVRKVTDMRFLDVSHSSTVVDTSLLV